MLDRSGPSRLAALTFALLAQNAAFAADSYTLTLKDHRFDPAELAVPAGQKFRLVVKNEDGTPEEFESKSLRREKIVKGKSEISLNLGPLDPGTYEFFGEFHEATAKGRLLVK
jgi:plastocyanin